MLTLLFFTAAGDCPQLDDLGHQVALIPGIELDGRQGDTYRPGRWRDPVTGARCDLDLGAPPIEDDHLHPPRSYDGFATVPLTIHIPLAGPHWLAVEALRPVESLLAALPGLLALDVEDAGEGPTSWSRPRIIASWHRQQSAFLETRPGHPRLNRNASLAMWRYRRERPAGLAARPELAWPECLVLGERLARGVLTPYSAALWRDPQRPLALPPVDLVIAMRAEAPVVLTAARLRCQAGVCDLDHGRAQLIPATAATAACFARGEARPASAFAALGDEDWTD